MGSATEPASCYSEPQEVTLIESASPSELARGVAAAIAQRLEDASVPTKRFYWGSDVSQLEGQACIVLTDLESALLKEPSPKDLAALQLLLSHAKSLLWVSGPLGPDAALVTGLARSVRNEVAGLQLRTLELTNLPISEPDTCADCVCRVFRYGGSDEEFRWSSGTLEVSRLAEDEDRNEELAQLLGREEKTPTETTLQQSPEAMKLCVRQVGMLDSLCFEPDTLASQPLAQGEVEVDVKASGVK